MNKVCDICGKRRVPFTMGDGVPVCDCEVEIERICFYCKHWQSKRGEHARHYCNNRDSRYNQLHTIENFVCEYFEEGE